MLADRVGDHRPRPDRRRGHAGGAEGGDRAPVGRGGARRARRPRRRRRPAGALRRARRPPRRAPRPCGWSPARTSRPSCARSTAAASASPTCSCTSPRSTTSSSPRRAASSTPTRSSADRAGRGRRVSLLGQGAEMARRSVLQTLRQPAMVIPPIAVPADPDGRQRRRAAGGDEPARLPDRRLPELRDRVPVHPGLAVRVDQRRLEPRARRRDRLPQAARADADAARARCCSATSPA